MAFQKTGTIFTIASAKQINDLGDWTKIAGRQLRHSNNIDGVDVNNNQALLDGASGPVVCEIDPAKFIYIHTTIMASVDLDQPKGFYITRETEKYINSNGDSWPREQLMQDYPTFMHVGTVFVEHDQNPEHAKGKVLDAIARDMGDCVLIDLLFCVDRRHADLVANIESGFANAVSMGCSTAYTICSICGNKAHNDKEYCTHIAKQKNQMVRCKDGVYRKAAELCYDNVFFDCSIVANPAFAGAVFRKLVAHNKIASELLSNLLTRKMDESLRADFIEKLASVDGKVSMDDPTADKAIVNRKENTSRFLPARDEDIENTRNETNGTTFPGYRGASMDKEAIHPIIHGDEADYLIDDTEFDDIPWHDPNNTLPVFDAQQPKDMTVMDADKKKKKKASIVGRLVKLESDFHIPKEHRKISMISNFLSKDMVGRIVSKEADGTYVLYFPKLGSIAGIPFNLLSDYQDEYNKHATTKDLNDWSDTDDRKGKDGISKNHKGAFVDSEDRFQVLDSDDDNVTFRFLTGPKMGTKETLPKSDFTTAKVKWASVLKISAFENDTDINNKLAHFEGKWNGKYYRLEDAQWNEKHASILDRLESHIDNIQNDITCVMPMQRGKYARNFSIPSSFDGNNIRFNVVASGECIQVQVVKDSK